MQPSIWVKVPLEEKQLLICFIHSKISFCVQGYVLRVSSILKVLWRTAAVRFPIALKASAPASPNQCGPCIVRPHSSSCPCIISIITAILPELWNGPHILYIHMLMLHCRKKESCLAAARLKQSLLKAQVRLSSNLFSQCSISIFLQINDKWMMQCLWLNILSFSWKLRQTDKSVLFLLMSCVARQSSRGKIVTAPKVNFPSETSLAFITNNILMNILQALPEFKTSRTRY